MGLFWDKNGHWMKIKKVVDNKMCGMKRPRTKKIPQSFKKDNLFSLTLDILKVCLKKTQNSDYFLKLSKK